MAHPKKINRGRAANNRQLYAMTQGQGNGTPSKRKSMSAGVTDQMIVACQIAKNAQSPGSRYANKVV